jgi:predicted outer membrane protein
MKKFAISLLALAAVSTAALASNRDITTPYGAQDTRQVSAVTTSNALVIPVEASGKAGDDLGLGGSNRR